jgi:septal ring factor EnvC (AmiA/AmiB activator)
MAHDLANANQEIETLKASLAELKASQQQMARDFAKASDKVAEQNAKAKVASVTQHAAAAVRKPAPPYSPPTPTTAAAAPGYRPVPSSYSTQAAMPQASPPATAQPYAPPPIPLQPQADPGLPPTAPRPPMPVQ